MVPWLLAAGALLVGGRLLLGGVWTLRRDRVRRATWRPYPGEVVASRLEGEQIRCQVAYRRADGTKVLFWNRFSSTTLTDPVGREVQVLENPADPREAVVSDGLAAGGRLAGAVFALAGGVFLVVGLGIGVVLLR